MSTCFFNASDPARMIGIVPSLLTAGISEDEAHTRATSSITIAVAMESAPAPPYASGMWVAWNPARTNASSTS